MSDIQLYQAIVSDNLPKHIKKGHQLVFSRQDLSSKEADLFALMIAHMKVTDWHQHTPHYKFTAQQLSDWLHIDPKHIGCNLSPVANRLSSRKVGIKLENKKGDIEFDYRPLFKHIGYKNGTLSMVPNDMLKSEYIEYNQGFALINTQHFFDVKKEYSKRLYELLSRFKDTGYEMQLQPIHELKGIFGLLDEAGKLKKEKASFQNNSVFMKRCIRESIKDLSTHPHISKELLFINGEQGEKGIEIMKSGRNIIGVKFLFRWLKRNAFEVLNQHNALINIKTLELKRLQNQQKLSIQELELLMVSYRQVEKYDQADLIEQTLEKRHCTACEPQQAKPSSLSTDLDALLEKIDNLAEINNYPDY